MAHYIEITLPPKALKNVDTIIAAWNGDEKIGELRISKGGVDWRAGKKKKPKSFRWEKLAKLLDEA